MCNKGLDLTTLAGDEFDKQLAALQAQFSDAKRLDYEKRTSTVANSGVDTLAKLLRDEGLAVRMVIVGINDLKDLQIFSSWEVERRRSVLMQALKLSEYQAEVMVQQIERAMTRRD